MCMEDLRIARSLKNRFAGTVPFQTFDHFKIPADPNRVAIIITSTAFQAGSFFLFHNDGVAKRSFGFGVVGFDPIGQVVPYGQFKYSIYEYGSLITDDIYVSGDGTGIRCDIYELYFEGFIDGAK